MNRHVELVIKLEVHAALHKLYIINATKSINVSIPGNPIIFIPLNTIHFMIKNRFNQAN